MRTRLAIASVLLLAQLGAQNPAPQTPPDVAPGGVFQLPSSKPQPREAPPAAAAPKDETPKKLILTYAGKPLQIPFPCGDEEIQSYALTCTENDPCPIYSELAALQVLGQKMFVAGNFHTDAATLASLLLSSDDGGKTWQEPFERIRSAGFDHIQFAELTTGWISGQVFDSLPRDPFFLLTTDGGKFWRRRPVFDEPRVASIESFWFESKTAGSMVVDQIQGAQNNARYGRYETLTGGDTWMIRELSAKPITIKMPADRGQNPDWRLRADAATQANLLERRVGERWQTVAAFLVKAGDCKSAPSVLAPPPPPEEDPAPAPAPPPTRGPARPSNPSLKK